MLCRALGRMRAQKFRNFCTAPGERLKVAVVGSGPGGFYTARTLLKKHPGIKIDIVEMLPVPFGLVRYGVAPDHADTKNVTGEFQGILDHPDCTLNGNVKVGKDVSLEELQGLFHAVVLAYGAEHDRALGIPGEDLSGSLSARAFVNWFNGHPHYAELSPDLNCEQAVLIGNGNVAIDVARILLKAPPALQDTDIAEHALDALRSSQVRRVHVVGRRGAAQAAWTTAELREAVRLPGVRVALRAEEVDLDDVDAATVESSRADRRRHQLLQETLAEGGSREERELHLRFLLSPVRIVEHLGAVNSGRVGGIVLGSNRLEGPKGSRKAVATGHEETVSCGLVLRSVGYRSLPIMGIPFDTSSNTVPHGAGRVLSQGGGAVRAGLYVSGWLKRGPTGIIGSNISDGQHTAMSILEDWSLGLLSVGAQGVAEGGDGLRALLASRGVTVVQNSGWKRIDARERALGKAAGRPRRKIVSVEEMLATAETPE